MYYSSGTCNLTRFVFFALISRLEWLSRPNKKISVFLVTDLNLGRVGKHIF